MEQVVWKSQHQVAAIHLASAMEAAVVELNAKGFRILQFIYVQMGNERFNLAALCERVA